ncbi:MAG: LysR family transcriptional regulator [Planctomycetes bacterium]|nr:LysR family transcriptional regulator [Planctomycetota bacterium]
MDPDRLKTFLAVEKHRNYTHAARELFLSQPAVSRQVHELERELGVRLFEQIGKTISLTDAGLTLAREAKDLPGSLERAGEAVRAHAGAGRGALRLGASTTPGFYLLPPVLGRFHGRFPAVEISYTIKSSRRIEEAILGNEIDLGFVGAHFAGEGLRSEPIAEDEVAFFSLHGLRDDFRRGRLKEVKVSGLRPKRPIYCVRHVGKHVSPAMEAFLGMVREAL